MVRYIIKRLFIGVVTIWALITITFFLIRIMPGSPFEADNLSQSAIEQLERPTDWMNPCGNSIFFTWKI